MVEKEEKDTVVIVLSTLWMWLLVVVWQNGMANHHHLLTE